MIDYSNLCLKVTDIVKETGFFIKSQISNVSELSVETKDIHNFVTYVDRESERRLINDLSKLLSNSGFLAEEDTTKFQRKEFTWIIDPLDGTTNFIHKVPLYSISVALLNDNNLVLGVIYEINLDECFYAYKDGGAYLNGQKIKVSKTNNLNDSLLATGFPYYDYKYLNEYMEFLKFTIKSTRGLRRLGSAAVDLAYVACGRFDAFYEYGLNAWDVAAGAFIVQEAGGKVTDFKNSNNYLFGKEIVASNGFIHNEMIENLNKYFSS